MRRMAIAALVWTDVATTQICLQRGMEWRRDSAPRWSFPSGLRGEIYNIPVGMQTLPKFEKLQPVGTIYTSELNVPRHDFTQGFPGVTGRFEWFAIDYTGKIWIDKPGKYTWALLSDDGSKLYIDGHIVIDNDGTHAPR